MIKILQMTRDPRNTLKGEKNGKWKVWEKFNNVKTTIKLFSFFVYGKNIFCSKIKFGKM